MQTAEAAIREHGLDGRRVLGLARDVTNYTAARTPHMSRVVRDDLESYLSETACRVALNYRPEQSGPGYSFASYLWDVLSRRTTDFYRLKREGFGDRRNGNAGRIVLSGLDVVNEETEGPPDDDPFERDVYEEAAAVAAELGLSPSACWTLTQVVVAVADGAGIEEAAQAAGITGRRAARAVEDLRDEVTERRGRAGCAIS